MTKWVCRAKGSLYGSASGRAEKDMRRIGFRWDGCDWSMESETKPPRPWGCLVRKYRPPAPPRKGFAAALGILAGTHDEFGRPLQKTEARNQLLAERTALERMIDSLPESSVIDRMSLEARKAKVEAELAATED